MRIGIDASDDGLRIVALSGASIRLETCDPHASAELARALADGGACTACTTPGTTLVVPLHPPPIPPAKQRKILPGLLDVQIPFPITDCAAAFVDVDGGCLAYAVRKTDLREQLEALSACGCDPVRVVPAAHAAWALATAEHPPQRPDTPRAVFIAGTTQTLLLTGRGTRMEHQSRFKTDAAEPLRRLRLVFGGLPDGLCCLIAGPAHATVSTALASVETPPSTLTPASPAFFLARALASDAKSAGTAADADLRRQAFPHPVTLRRRRRTFVWPCMAATVCAIAVAATAVAALAHARTVEARAHDALQDRLDTLAGYPIRSRGERALQDVRAALPMNMDAAVLQHHANTLPRQLATLADLCNRHHITLRHLSLTADGLTASGDARTESAVAAWVRDLQAAGLPSTLTEPAKPVGTTGFTFFILPTQP